MSAVMVAEEKKLPKLAGKEADPQAIIQQYLDGKKTEEIAKHFGITRQGLGYWLRKHAETEWKESQVIAALERKDKAEDIYDDIQRRIETADKDERDRLTLMLSLAREKLKAAQWDLERVCRRIYGDDRAAQVSGLASLTIEIRGGSATISPQTPEMGGLTIDHATQAIDK